MGPFQDADLLSPGSTVNTAHGSNLESSRHLSRSNIDIPRSNGNEDPKRQLPRKRSDSSTSELDTIQQHQAFLSRWVGTPPLGEDGDSKMGRHGPGGADGQCERPEGPLT